MCDAAAAHTPTTTRKPRATPPNMSAMTFKVSPMPSSCSSGQDLLTLLILEGGNEREERRAPIAQSHHRAYEVRKGIFGGILAEMVFLGVIIEGAHWGTLVSTLEYSVKYKCQFTLCLTQTCARVTSIVESLFMYLVGKALIALLSLAIAAFICMKIMLATLEGGWSYYYLLAAPLILFLIILGADQFEPIFFKIRDDFFD